MRSHISKTVGQIGLITSKSFFWPKNTLETKIHKNLRYEGDVVCQFVRMHDFYDILILLKVGGIENGGFPQAPLPKF